MSNKNFYWNLIKSNAELEIAWENCATGSDCFDSEYIARFNKVCEKLGVPIVLTHLKKVTDYNGEYGGWQGHNAFKFNDDLFRLDGVYDSWGDGDNAPDEFAPAKPVMVQDYDFVTDEDEDEDSYEEGSSY